MASINGIALKAVKTFQTMDGVGFQSNVYIGNKKIGVAGDGGFGGSVDIHILPEYRKEFSKRIQDYFEKHPAYLHTDEDFINELYELLETENQFKKNTKKGFPILISLSCYNRLKGFDFEQPYQSSKMIGVIKESQIEEQVKKHKPIEYTVYRTLNDFILTI
jgi:hypothetical protein